MLRSIAKMGSVTMLAIIAMNGCGGDDDDEVTNPPPGPTTGSINVTVAGLPAATNAARRPRAMRAINWARFMKRAPLAAILFTLLGAFRV